MKRVFISIIALAAALNLCACGDKSEHKSKSREKSSSKVETQDKTEKETLPDLANNYTMVDAFEKSFLKVYGTYPDNFTAFFCTADSDYNRKINYDCVMKVADAEKIIIEVKADYSKYEDDLKELGYKFESDTKTYELSLDDMKNSPNHDYRPCYDYSTRLLKKSQLTDENINAIREHCYNRITSPENIEKIYALIPKTSLFLEDYTFTDKSETGVKTESYQYKPEMLQKVLSNQVFVINRTFSITTDEWSEEINTFGVGLENGEIVSCEMPSPPIIYDESGNQSFAKIDEEVNACFEKILDSYKKQGYDFEVVEIPIAKG